MLNKTFEKQLGDILDHLYRVGMKHSRADLSEEYGPTIAFSEIEKLIKKKLANARREERERVGREAKMYIRGIVSDFSAILLGNKDIYKSHEHLVRYNAYQLKKDFVEAFDKYLTPKGNK